MFTVRISAFPVGGEEPAWTHCWVVQFLKQAPDPKVTMVICVPLRAVMQQLKMESKVILSMTPLKASWHI